MGAAIDYTVQYFDALKDTLHAQEGNSGKLEIDLREINRVTIDLLRVNLRDLNESSLADSAIRDIRTDETAQISKRKIRTTAVGLAGDFDLSTRMGFIIGEQVVLWDAIIPNILSNPRGVHLGLLKKISEDILAWYPVAARGGLVYLRHQRVWSDASKREASIISGLRDVSPDFLGLLTAEALAEEKYNLSPYAFSPWSSELVKLYTKLKHKAPTQPNKSDYESLRGFLRCGSVYALRHVSPDGFYDVLRSAEETRLDESSPMYRNDWRRQLKEHLEYDSGDLLEYEREILRQRRLDDLDNLMKQQAMILEQEHVSTSAKRAGKLGAVSGLIGVVAGFLGASVPAAIFKTLNKAFGAYAGLREDFGDKLPKRKEELLFQVFFDLEKQWDKEIKRELKGSLRGTIVRTDGG